MSDRIERIKQALEHGEKCRATHVESVVVKETFLGDLVWEGVVETFNLHDHPTAKRAYAWERWREDRSQEPKYTIVLGIPPVKTPNDAIKAWVLSIAKKSRSKSAAD